MSLFVVDASVGVKWFVPEDHSDAAQRLQDPVHELHIPAFFDVEVANIVWKKLRRGGTDPCRGGYHPGATSPAPGDSPPGRSFGHRGIRSGCQNDCIYLALAVDLGGIMVTADERLANSLAVTPWAAAIIQVQDLP